MERFLIRQIEMIVELFQVEEETPKIPWIRKAIQVLGNITFVLTTLVLLYKGLFFLLNYLLPEAPADTVNGVMRNAADKILFGNAHIIIATLAIFLFVTRLILFLKVWLKPFQILALYGAVKAIMELIHVSFDKDIHTFTGFLDSYLKGLF
jgi:hypothetical protein